MHNWVRMHNCIKDKRTTYLVSTSRGWGHTNVPRRTHEQDPPLRRIDTQNELRCNGRSLLPQPRLTKTRFELFDYIFLGS